MNERKVSVPRLIPVILSLLLAVGADTFLGPCGHGGPCDRAGHALVYEGIGLTVLTAMAMLPCKGKIRAAVCAAALILAVFAFLTPGTLMPICGGAGMRCRMVMRPACMIVAGLIFLFVAANAGLEIRKAQKGKI